MPAKPVDLELRERLRAWILYLMNDLGMDEAAFARHTGVAQSAINNLKNRKRGMGIENLARIHRALHKSIDTMVDMDPPTTTYRRPSELSQGGGVGRSIHEGKRPYRTKKRVI